MMYGARRLTFEVLGAEQLVDSQRADIIHLRTAAFHQDFSPLFDWLPPASTHILTRPDGELVGHAAWVNRWLQPGQQPFWRTAYVEAATTALRSNVLLTPRFLGAARLGMTFAGAPPLLSLSPRHLVPIIPLSSIIPPRSSQGEEHGH